MRRFRLIESLGITLLFLLCSHSAFAKQLSLSVSSESAILINADTGCVLYEKDAEKIMFPASTTKIATALYTLKTYGDKLDTMIEADHNSIASISEEAKRRANFTMPSHWLEVGSTHMSIKNGEVLSLRDLLYGMMISSANDASNMIASFIGGSPSSFTDDLNQYLKTIGCKNTHFKNPHGLHHPKHLTTAKDLALITKEALKDDQFCQIVKTVKYTRPETNLQPPSTLIQFNKLLRPGRLYYKKATGVKTGYTSHAKSTLVASAEDGDRRLIAVLLKCDNKDQMFKDAKMMFEKAFSQPKVRRLLIKAGPQKYKAKAKGGKRLVTANVEKNVWIEFYPAEEPEITCLLYWNRLKAPINKGEHVGQIKLVADNGSAIQTLPITSYEDVPLTLTKRLKNVFSSNKNKTSNRNSNKPWKIFTVILMLLSLCAVLWRLKRSR